MLIIFEDVSWVDHSTADLMTKLISFIRAEALPVLVMLTHRPIMNDDADAPKMLVASLTSEANANHDKRGRPTILKLNALKRHESFAIIKHVAKNRQLGSSLLESIAVRADDVPLFVEEVTNYVLEFGKLHDLDEHQPVLLERIRPYLTGRLDGLGMAVKEVAQVGSVIGRSFTALLVSRGSTVIQVPCNHDWINSFNRSSCTNKETASTPSTPLSTYWCKTPSMQACSKSTSASSTVGSLKRWSVNFQRLWRRSRTYLHGISPRLTNY